MYAEVNVVLYLTYVNWTIYITAFKNIVYYHFHVTSRHTDMVTNNYAEKTPNQQSTNQTAVCQDKANNFSRWTDVKATHDNTGLKNQVRAYNTVITDGNEILHIPCGQKNPENPTHTRHNRKLAQKSPGGAVTSRYCYWHAQNRSDVNQ